MNNENTFITSAEVNNKINEATARIAAKLKALDEISESTNKDSEASEESLNHINNSFDTLVTSEHERILNELIKWSKDRYSNYNDFDIDYLNQIESFQKFYTDSLIDKVGNLDCEINNFDGYLDSMKDKIEFFTQKMDGFFSMLPTDGPLGSSYLQFPPGQKGPSPYGNDRDKIAFLEAQIRFFSEALKKLQGVILDANDELRKIRYSEMCLKYQLEELKKGLEKLRQINDSKEEMINKLKEEKNVTSLFSNYRSEPIDLLITGQLPLSSADTKNDVNKNQADVVGKKIVKLNYFHQNIFILESNNSFNINNNINVNNYQNDKENENENDKENEKEDEDAKNKKIEETVVCEIDDNSKLTLFSPKENEDEYDRLLKANDELSHKIDILNKIRDQLENRIANIENEYKTQIDDLQKNNDELNSILNEKIEENMKLSEKLENKKKKSKELQDALNELKNDSLNKQNEIDKILEQQKLLQAKDVISINEIISSFFEIPLIIDNISKERNKLELNEPFYYDCSFLFCSQFTQTDLIKKNLTSSSPYSTTLDPSTTTIVTTENPLSPTDQIKQNETNEQIEQLTAKSSEIFKATTCDNAKRPRNYQSTQVDLLTDPLGIDNLTFFEVKYNFFDRDDKDYLANDDNFLAVRSPVSNPDDFNSSQMKRRVNVNNNNSIREAKDKENNEFFEEEENDGEENDNYPPFHVKVQYTPTKKNFRKLWTPKQPEVLLNTLSPRRQNRKGAMSARELGGGSASAMRNLSELPNLPSFVGMRKPPNALLGSPPFAEISKEYRPRYPLLVIRSLNDPPLGGYKIESEQVTAFKRNSPRKLDMKDES